MRTRLLAGTVAGTLAGLTLVLGGAIPATAADATKAHLSVLHAVPGLTVDVWVNGQRTLDDFTPGSLAGPLELAPGTYTVAITASNAADASAPAIGPVDLPLAAGVSYTAVAHLDAAGTPTATLFTNDTSATQAGQGRLTVRHVAAAPAVDILAGGSAVITNLVNPQERKLDLPVGTVSAAVAATGTTTPVLGPADVAITDGTNTIVYAWGSLSGGNLALATQTVATASSSPAGVPSGELGLADDSGAPVTWLVAGAAALALAGAAALGARRRALTVEHGRRTDRV